MKARFEYPRSSGILSIMLPRFRISMKSPFVNRPYQSFFPEVSKFFITIIAVQVSAISTSFY